MSRKAKATVAAARAEPGRGELAATSRRSARAALAIGR